MNCQNSVCPINSSHPDRHDLVTKHQCMMPYSVSIDSHGKCERFTELVMGMSPEFGVEKGKESQHD